MKKILQTLLLIAMCIFHFQSLSQDSINFSKLNVIYLANKGAIIYEDSAMKKPVQRLPYNAEIRLMFRKDSLYQFKYKKVIGYIKFKDFCSRYISNKKGGVIYKDKELTQKVTVIPFKERKFEEQSVGRNKNGVQVSFIKWNNIEGYIKWDDFFLDY